MKMHDDEADIDADLVRRLVAAQFPRLAGLPVTPFRSTGTVNAIYRLGDDLHQAVLLIPYYRETNPGMAALGRRTVGQVLADLRARGGDAAGPGPSARSRW